MSMDESHKLFWAKKQIEEYVEYNSIYMKFKNKQNKILSMYAYLVKMWKAT